MDISNAIAQYLNDVVFSKWSITGCLEFLAEKDIWVTSQKREEIMNEFKRQMEMTSTHKSVIQKARNKAAKLSSSTEQVFQFEEIKVFFDQMEKEANERLLNVKTSSTSDLTTPVRDAPSLVMPSATNSVTALVDSR
ncbi:3958_t:CDS:2, partial [Paraglomus occultum]